jgi:chromosome partitioning protein
VPLQPSIFDILATRQFLEQLFEEKEVRRHEAHVAVVAMRVDARTRAAAELERFLADMQLPVVAHLRDTQNYVQAAAHGMSIFELPPSRAEKDVEQWQPLLDWVHAKP